MDERENLASLEDKGDDNSWIWHGFLNEGDVDFPKLKTIDVAQLLQVKSVYVSGGFDKNGSPLIIFPHSQKFADISQEDIEKIFHYLVQRFGSDERKKGFTALIDRRSENWMSVKLVLDRLKFLFTATAAIQNAYVIKPQGFFQKYSESSFRSNQSYNFQVTILNDINVLYEYVDKSQLTPCLGGSLMYNHQEWVQYRTGDEDLLERQMSSCLAISQTSVADLQQLVDEMSRVKDKFEQEWTYHQKCVVQSLQYNFFETEFVEIKNLLVDAQKKLSRMKELGDSVTAAKKLKIDTESLKDETKGVAEKLKDMCERGEVMIKKDNYHSNSIKLKCSELEDLNKDFEKKLEERMHTLNKSAEVHECLTQAGKWCNAGLDILASQPAERFQSPEGAETSLREIDDFLKKPQGVNLRKLNRLEKTTKELGDEVLLEQVRMALKRISDVTEMMRNRELSFKKMVIKRPVQEVAPVLPSHSPTSQTSKSPLTSKRRGGVSPLLHVKKDNTKGQKTGSSTTQRGPISIIVTSDSTSTTKSQITPGERPRSVSVNSPRNSNDFEVEDEAVLVTKRAQVMNELVETEKVYVSDLQCVVEGYMKQYHDSSPNLPRKLKGKKGIIFGNIYEIYEFHRDIFLRDLEKCANQPLLVGEVFLAKENEFQMYAAYCKNKPSSEALRNECAEVDFFVKCQESLGHQLPLHAYLLKPIQRITKYQLILKQMIKYSQACVESLTSLKNALDAMMKVLKNLNDVMHSTYIRGFLGKLSDQGKLLMQDTFNVRQSRKKHVINMNLTHFKGKPRQIFLYEKLIVITKRDDEEAKDNVFYQFKSSLKLVDVGLTETVKEDPLKFGLLHKKSEFYTLQAPSDDIKNLWVQEIRRLLQSQFSLVKESKSLAMSPELSPKDYRSFNWEQERSTSSVDNQLKVSNNNEEEYNDVLTKSVEEGDDYDDYDENEWSDDSEWSDDEDENTTITEVPYTEEPDIYYGIADYKSIEETELSFLHGDILYVLRVGDGGWWYARCQRTSDEGWVPGSYLEKRDVDVQ
ncbi:guanine nucleotide exchange factor DBS-like isoform X2 [Xenia sp. Carnegie-2017]|uniref:guanine nucleotide exchange factor DBS-like isoform X2 n=1 Tax=Xenia sp. Carnegie-2017 TaxID=2897299 RepID=UPI001F0430DC|nr:guanine nucleotide exchange factor DBS-like isoform X2 [Xenia sp. Carnegie-2017]